MSDPIQEMRARLTERFNRAQKPIQGLNPTAFNAPRLPQSRIPSPRPKYDTAGRPPEVKRQEVPLQRKKPRDIWGGWL
jgi:hypothetical protein